MNKSWRGFRTIEYILFAIIMLAVMVICVCAGSVRIPLKDALKVFAGSLFHTSLPDDVFQTIIMNVRLPRVLSVALVGAALSICGVAMQGLLKNPLADGSTLGVSSGASLGAVFAMTFSINISFLPGAGTMLMSMLFSFLSMFIILSLAHKLDFSLSTNTIILVGVIFSMFASSITSLLITFAGNKVKTIVFWTLGSLAGSSYREVIIMLVFLAVCGGILLRYARELNAFAVGEENARHIGVDVRRIKLIIMIVVSALIGVCVSISGTIGFVGLVIPHMTRMLVGPNHKRLLPASMFSGAVFLMLADLVSRVILRPLELPIGVVTSFVGSIAFIYIFYSTRKRA